jgi:phosphoglycolate phosphatase-like HAD superfamily hydrolase/predicted amidophosphoribosyltransferase
MQAVLFDLDQTLVDSSALEEYRRLQLWDYVLGGIGQITLYPGIPELIHSCRALGLKTAIVTSSPRNVCDAIVNQFGLQTDATVAAGDAKFPKPSREPITAALQKLAVHRSQALVVGDRCLDIAAGRHAEVAWTLGATWGTPDLRSLVLSRPKYFASNASEAAQFVLALSQQSQYRDWLLQKAQEADANYTTQMWVGHEGDPKERGYLRGGTFPYYFCRSRLKGKWYSSYANSLIKNLKMSETSSTQRTFKLVACDKMATELVHLIRTLNLPGLTVAFIPSSKQKTDPVYDKRFDYVAGYLRQKGIAVAEPIMTRTSHQAVHSDEDSFADRAPSAIRENLDWKGFEGEAPANLLLVDDVMTSGGHFRACSELIKENAPPVNIVGAFWTVQISP